MHLYSMKVQLKVPVVVRLEGTNVDQGKSILKVNFETVSPVESYRQNVHYVFQSCLMKKEIHRWLLFWSQIWLQESGMTLITAEDLDDAAEKAVKAAYNWGIQMIFSYNFFPLSLDSFCVKSSANSVVFCWTKFWIGLMKIVMEAILVSIFILRLAGGELHLGFLVLLIFLMFGDLVSQLRSLISRCFSLSDMETEDRIVKPWSKGKQLRWLWVVWRCPRK